MIYIHIKHKDTYIGAALTYLLIYIKHTVVFIEVIDINNVADPNLQSSNYSCGFLDFEALQEEEPTSPLAHTYVFKTHYCLFFHTFLSLLGPCLI